MPLVRLPLRHAARLFSSYASNGRAAIPAPVNEPVPSFLKGTAYRAELEAALQRVRSEVVEIPCVIGGREVFTGDVAEVRIPHDHGHVLARYHRAGAKEAKEAIDAAMAAKASWAGLDFEHRASVFLRMAEQIAGPHRAAISAATMLNQSKNFQQAEIDIVCELIDFLRFNAHFAQQIYEEQPQSPTGMFNRMTYRPLEGFIYAVTPFNFTCIAANLAATPAMMGNTIVWKPSDHTVFSNWVCFQLMRECGLPDGVINFLPGDPVAISNTMYAHPDLAGIHYTGSSQVFRNIFKAVGDNMNTYKSFPRIVGETGGKDFIFAHPSAQVQPLVVALIRGSFEFCGQKCSASSRAYIPKSLWPSVQSALNAEMANVKMGSSEDPANLVNAVIHKGAFDKCKAYIEHARNTDGLDVIIGGGCDDTVGYFVEPTVVVSQDPKSKLMAEEIFGPILTIHVYDDNKFEETLEICDQTSEYALTGAIWAQDRFAIDLAMHKLDQAAGNFYINDKPTGSIVAQQPFGGARGSGTNDKAGSKMNLLRWVSARTIKETYVPPTEVAYPYMKE